MDDNDEKINFIKYLEKASRIVQKWPVWKQSVLSTANSSYIIKLKTFVLINEGKVK